MYSTTTALEQVSGLLSDGGVMIAAAVAGVLGGWIALVGLGFAVKQIQKRVTGKKF